MEPPKPVAPNPSSAFRTFTFLPNGRFRFDDGPALSVKGLKSEIIRMAREHDCRDVHLNTAKVADYSHVAKALGLFQKYGCNDLGFRGLSE